MEVVVNILGRDGLEAHRLEQPDHLLRDLGQGMEPAAAKAHSRQGDVNPLLGQRALHPGAVLRFLQRLDPAFQFTLDFIDQLPDCGPLRGGYVAHPAHDRGQFARAPQHPHAHILDLLRAGIISQLTHGVITDGFELFFHSLALFLFESSNK